MNRSVSARLSPARRSLLAGASAVVVSGTLVATLATGATPAVASSDETVAYGGIAYGAHVLLGRTADVGKLAVSPMCTTRPGELHSNRTARTDLGVLGCLGAVTSQVHSSHEGADSTSSASTHTAYTKLAGGMLTLGAVTTAASVTHHATSYSAAGSSVFAGLRVAGRSFPATVPANSTYTLPGLGSLTLNAQRASTRGGVRAMTVTALRLTLGAKNSAGLPTGQIVIGRSTATLRLSHRVPSGYAYATAVSVASLAGSGRTAAAYTPCGGTGNVTHSNDVAGLALPDGVAGFGAATSAVNTTDSATRTTSTSRNHIAGVTLLNGMVTARALNTQANVAVTDGRRTADANGTTLLGLVVDGTAVAAPRTGSHQTIPGLGTLYFASAQQTPNGLLVYGLRLVLGSAHDGLPAGAVITVGAAKATVTG